MWVDFLKYDFQEETIKVKTPVAGNLIVSESYYPGWHAYIDGKEMLINEVDGIFRSVEISSGTHEIRFLYHPDLFYKGLKVSLFSLVVLIEMIGYTLIVKRKNVKN